MRLHSVDEKAEVDAASCFVFFYPDQLLPVGFYPDCSPRGLQSAASCRIHLPAIRHAPHRNDFRSTARNSSERISAIQWPQNSPDLTQGLPWCLWCDVGEAPSKLVSHWTQRSVAVICDSLCHRSRLTTLLEASHYDWTDAQKLLVTDISRLQTD